MVIDRDFTLSTLVKAIQIDSRNPALEEGAPGERELARYVEALMQQLGWTVALHELQPLRANVVATLPGKRTGPSLMINVHLDTVGTAGMDDPFSGTLRDGRIWGRGAQDIKGGIAAVLGTAKALAERRGRLGGEVILAFVADEEHESIGTADVIRRVKADAAIVIEPSDLDVCIAHRGFGIIRVRTRGRTAHGGRSDLGIDANMHMAHALAELDRWSRAWQQRYRHAMLGPGTLHVPRLSGGRQLFTYADECWADIEVRTVPGMAAEDLHRELQAILDSLQDRVDGFDASVDLVLWRSPYEIAADRPIVRTLSDAVETTLGRPPRTIAHTWWEDAALLGEAGIETVIIGPCGDGLHTEREWVDPDSVVALAEILYQTVLAHCGRA